MESTNSGMNEKGKHFRWRIDSLTELLKAGHENRPFVQQLIEQFKQRLEQQRQWRDKTANPKVIYRDGGQP